MLKLRNSWRFLWWWWRCRGWSFLVSVILSSSFLSFPKVNSQLATWSSVYESSIIKAPQPGWVRFCKEDQFYDAFANQCPAGVFWDDNKDTIWDCVCTRGSWRRSAGWCTGETTQRFTQGDVTCFELDPEEQNGLQGMYYVGDRFSFWDSSLPILLSDYSSGIPLRKGDLRGGLEVSSRTKMNPGVLIYRPRDDWMVEDKTNNATKLCLRAPSSFNEETEGLFIYSVSKMFDSSGGPQRIELSFTRGCFSWNEDDGVTWHEVVGESLVDKNMIVPSIDGDTVSERCLKCMSKPIPPAPDFDIDGGPLEEREEYTIFDLKNVAVLKSEVDLQTERLGHYWAHRVLQNGSDFVNIDFQELEILTKAAILAYDVCDKTLIPLEFYQYFLTMFRMLLSESFKKYPREAPINPEYYAKINKILNKCKENRLEFKFKISETCPPFIMEYSTGSQDSQQVNTTGDYSSDKGRHDFLLEFIWRLKSFMHYKCFQEFQADAILLDMIQHQLETLFTEDLILRWYNPGNSFQMYSLLFESRFDLDAAMKNFQRCIVATHDVSRYPVWLKRPIDRPEIIPKKGSGTRLKRRKREAEKLDSDHSEEEYYDDEEELEGTGKTTANNLFGGGAACIKSIKKFMTDSNRNADSKCW